MSTTTVEITGKNAMDLQLKTNAINVLKNLPTEELQFLGQLGQSAKARKKLMNNKGTIKMLIGL